MREKYTESDITVVICAYKECKYLEACILSILAQTKKVLVKISTSTPNTFIDVLAEKYQLEVFVNPHGGHTQDYNFALKQIKTKLGVLAHQDDLFESRYIECCLKELNHSKKPIIVFTDYLEIHQDNIDWKPSAMVRIKKLLMWPVKIKWLRGKYFGKRMLQCIGNPITHPSVMYVMEEMPRQCFRKKYKASMDWDLWERLSNKKGEFLYVDKVLLYHRMNKENTTALLIESTNCRYQEELEILERFWSKKIARFIMKFYSKAQKYY